MTEVIKCNICLSGDMEHVEINNSHVYICEECPNVQFEYVYDKDIKNLITLLEARR